MLDIFTIILPTFSVILIGYLFGKFRNIDVSALIDISLYVGIPALIFVSLVQAEIVIVDALKIWAAAVIIVLGTMLVAWITFKLIRQQHSGLYLPIGIMNNVNIPFPTIYLAYGTTGMAAAILFNVPFPLIVFTFGTHLMSRRHWKQNIKEVFSQPALYASILGLALNFARVQVPALLIDTLNFISLIAIPLVLLVLGYNLSKLRVTSLPITLLASFLRMGIGIGLGFLVTLVFDITGVFRTVVILISAMPAAAMSSILAAKYDNEAELVSSVVFVTTLISLITVPVMLRMLG